MRDKDVGKAVADILESKKIRREIHPSFEIYGSNGEHRLYDISYLSNSLAVYVEAELARAKGACLNETIVTTEQNNNYKLDLKEAKERFIKKNPPHMLCEDTKIATALAFLSFSAEKEGLYSYEGVLVDSSEDKKMETARVKSVLVEYIGINLSEFVARQEYDNLIVALMKKYNISRAGASNGVLRITRSDSPGIIHLPGESKEEPTPSHFRKEIKNLTRLSSGIEAVLTAGQKLEKAVRAESDRLMRFL